jgi:hypothetical protein
MASYCSRRFEYATRTDSTDVSTSRAYFDASVRAAAQQPHRSHRRLRQKERDLRILELLVIRISIAH